MLPYGRQSIDATDEAEVLDALRAAYLSTGPLVEAFEEELAAWTDGITCVAVSSGSAALHVAYAAAGVGPDDDVVTSPMTFIATASAAVALGARVVFADIEDETANLDAGAVAAALTGRTRVVTAVDYAGHPAEYDDLRKLTDTAGVVLIADAAHAIGSTYRGIAVGALADLTTFSFYPTKNMTTAEGGAVAVADESLLTAARRFRNHGLVRDRAHLREPDEGGWHQEVATFGLNYRLPDLLCALGRSQLRRLGTFKARRAALVRRYRSLLADVPGLRLPAQRAWVDPAWHLFAVRILDGRRRQVYDALHRAGIRAQVNYLPAYRHPAFADLGYRRGMCPVAEQFYAEQLSLPLFADLSDADQDRVVEVLRSVLR